MTLRPGESFGEPGLLPGDAPVASSDRGLAQLLADRRSDSSEPTPIVGLAGGDLCRTLGGRGDVVERLGTRTHLTPIDAGEVALDGEPAGLFVAHLVARGRLWRGETLVVMNADVLGDWRPAPRAHPGDGLLDAVHGSLGLRERLLARQRLRSGDHLPHPHLHTERGATISWRSDRPRQVALDGVVVGRHRAVSVQVIPSIASVAV